MSIHKFEELHRSRMPHAIVTLDGVVQQVNQAWAQYFRGHHESFSGEPTYRLIEPADRTRFLTAWENLGPYEATHSQELRPNRGIERGESVTWLFRTSVDTELVIVSIATEVESHREPSSPKIPGIDSLLLDSLDDLGNGIAVFVDERIQWVNHAMTRITGWEASELIGTDGFQLVANNHREEVRQRRQNRIAGQNLEHHYEIDGLRRDGTVIRLEISVHSRLDPDGSGTGRAIISVRDVTERHRRNRRQEREERLQSLGELAATLGREYNNIVMAYTLATDALRDRAEIPSTAPEFQRLERLNRKAIALTRRLITLEGRPLSQPALTDANVIAWEAMERCAHLPVEFVPRLTPGLPKVTLDRDQLELVLTELLENAATASRTGGIVLVETTERVVSEHDQLDEVLGEGHYLVLRIADDGDGISEEILEHVVEPFFTTRPLESMGLGLPTAHAIVRNLGGHMIITSRDRVGTRIEIFLPVDRLGQVPTPTRKTTARPLPSPINVMVVDSSELLRELLSDELRRMGHEVTAATTPNEAFALLQSGVECDVMVAELVSLGGDGFDFVRRLRGENLDVCVVLTSGRSEVSMAGLEEDLPNLAFLHKPFTADRLDREIRAVLTARRDFV